MGEKPNSDTAFLHDVARRIFHQCTPAMGFDQGDSDRLHFIANCLTTAQAEIEALRIAVAQAAEWFEEYADAHAAKAQAAPFPAEAADRKHKAVRNAERAATMRAALSGSQT